MRETNKTRCLPGRCMGQNTQGSHDVREPPQGRCWNPANAPAGNLALRERWGSGSGYLQVLPESLAGSWSSLAAGHHSRRQPVLPEGDRETEAGGETGTSMPLPNLPVFKQSRDQAAGECQCQPRLSIVRWRLADDSRLRGSTHDPERPSEVAADGGMSLGRFSSSGKSSD
jgi:hypothetical protein